MRQSGIQTTICDFITNQMGLDTEHKYHHLDSTDLS